MKRWVWVLALLPGVAGVVVAGLAANQAIGDPVLYLRGSLSALALRAGLTISVIVIAAGLAWGRVQRKHVREVSEIQKAAAQERQRFLQRLDHELKNPLTAIRTGLMNMDYLSTEAALVEEVTAVRTQVLRIGRLVTDLRKLTSIGTTPVEKSEVNMSELLKEVVGALREQPDFANRRLNLVLPEAPWPLPSVAGDPDLLLLAIHNLVDNAVKFTTSTDTIEVRAFEDGRDVAIEVADTGPGIPEHEIDHVWEELYRGEGARAVPGSGLGLPLVQAIIEQHGGSVGLRSRPEQGTVFSVRLPTK
jgi:signal transduction histidine kinase